MGPSSERHGIAVANNARNKINLPSTPGGRTFGFYQVRYALLLGVLVAAPSAQGQTLTTTVPANSNMTAAMAAAVNLATNKVYVASSAGSNAGAITIINGETNSYINISDPNATSPQAVAVNPVTNKIYVANQSSNNVTVVDGSTDTVASSVNVGNAPSALAVNPLTNLIYVANNSAATVSVINGSSDTVVATVTVGNAPGAVAVNPVTNKIYVANNGSGTISVIDGATNAVTSVSGAISPVALSVNPATNQIYVADSGSANLMVIDGAANVATTLSLGVDGTGKDVAANPVTNTVYVADTNDVSVFSGATATTSAALITTLYAGSSPYAVAIDPISNKIYVANYGSGNVAVIDGATNSFVTVADSHASGPYAVTVNPVTNKAYVVIEPSDSVDVVDGASYPATSVTDPSAENATAVTVNPLTNTAYVANSQSNTVTVITGSAYTTSVNVGTGPDAILADPLTNTIYVANYASNNVSVVSGATNAVVTTVADPSAKGPYAVSGNPVTNTLYVANYTSNNVSVISGATNTLMTTMADPGAANPYAVAVNPVTNLIYVANYTSGTVSVFTGDTNTLIAAPVVGTNPVALVMNPKTNMIYVANSGSNNVSVINGATNTVVAAVTDSSALNPIAVDVNTLTNTIYVANNGVYSDFPSAVTVINGADNTFTSIDDPYACAPVGVAVNHVSNKIYLANSCASYPYGDGGTAIAVTVIDGATNSLGYAATNNQLINPVAVAVNPPAGDIYVADSGSVGENNAVVIAEQSVNMVPITTTVTPLANDQTSSLTPTFTFTATNSLTAAPIDNLLFLEGNWQEPWLVGTSAGAGSFTGTAPKLTPGFHTLYAFATDGEEATSTNTGSGTGLLAGNITAYSFLVPAPEASFSPGSLTFGAAIAVDTATPQQTVTLTNAGSYALTVASVALGGANPGDYAESDACAASSPIAAQGTCTINVTFTPEALGARLATLVVTDDSGDKNGTQHEVSLTGTAVTATTTTTVTPSANPSGIGQSVTFTATVTPNTPVAPTGTVTFKDGTATICNAVAPTSGEAMCAISTLTAGLHSIAAVYSGDINFLTSASTPLSQTVGVPTLTITASSSSTAYGATVPAVTPSYSGFINGDTPASLTTPPTCVTTGVPAGHPVGTYTGANNCSGAVDSNYTITYVPGNVQITSVPLTITASSGTFTYGGTLPTITPSYSGFVNGDTAASLTTTPTCSTTATNTSPVSGSPYASTCAGAVDSNYTIQYAKGSVTESAAATTTAIMSMTPNPSIVGQPVTVSYKVTVNSSGGVTIPGSETVTVTDSTGASCQGTISAGDCALVPMAVGPDTMTATYAGDSDFSASKISVTGSFSAVPTISLSGLKATPSPTQPTSVSVALSAATPTPLTGTLTLSFQSSAAGTPANYIDPGTQFAAGGTTLNFTIPAGSAIATLAQNGAIQQGTTAGTIIVTLTSLLSGTTAVTLPQPNPSLTLIVTPMVPVITSGSLTITGQTATGFNVELDAYSTARDLANATFTFQAASGSQLNGGTPSPISLAGVGPAWFSSSSGLQNGGLFHLIVPFTFSGNTSALGSVSATLSNSVGASSPATVAF
jgi:YVTN family beta-propeller protein